MGYYVNLIETNAYIPKDNLLNAYRALCALNERNDLKRGGSFCAGAERPLRGAHRDIWFSWMDWNYPETCADAEAVLRQAGYELVREDNGDVRFVDYDNKTGCEQQFVAAIGRYLASTDGRPVQFVWRGEDDALWRQIKMGDRLVTEDAEVVVRWPSDHLSLA